jgi:hypothetical protein
MPRSTSLQTANDNLGQRPSATPMLPQPLINRPGIRRGAPLSRNV